MDRRSFSSQTLTTLAAQAAGVVLSVLSGAIIARNLGPEGKGIVTVALLAPTFIGLAITWGIGTSNVYYARKMTPSQLSGHSMTLAIAGSIVGVAIVALLISTGWAADLFPGVSSSLLLLGALGLPLTVLAGYLSGILQGLQRIRDLNAIQVAQAATRLVFTALLVVSLATGEAGAVAATVVAGAVGLALTAWRVRREGGSLRPAWEPATGRALLSFGLKGQAGNVLAAFTYRLDAMIMNLVVGSAAVGIYSVSFRLAELLWFVPNAVAFVLLPRVAGADDARADELLPRVLGWTLGLGAAGALALIVIGLPLIELIYSSSFDDAFVPMLILLPGAVLFGGAKVLASRITGGGYPHWTSAAALVAAVLTVILDVILIPRFEIEGAAAASSITYAVSFVLAVAMVSRIRARERRDPRAGKR